MLHVSRESLILESSNFGLCLCAFVLSSSSRYVTSHIMPENLTGKTLLMILVAEQK
jgi:hypothetical protein